MHAAERPTGPPAGRYAILRGWRALAVEGPDARDWLEGLLSVEVAGLGTGEARRALLLTRTGRVRAEVAVACRGPEAFLLLQHPAQPAFIGDLLAPYVLSSKVALADRSTEVAVVALPDAGAGSGPLDGAAPSPPSAPSCLGDGADLLVPAGRLGQTVAALEAAGLRPASPADLEGRRVLRGRAEMAGDAEADDLPDECGLGEAASSTKGCYLGQEAVARTRNLGHPRRLLLQLRAAGPAARGEPILDPGGEPAGSVTSAAPDPNRPGDTAVLARIRWDARDAALRTAAGVPLAPW